MGSTPERVSCLCREIKGPESIHKRSCILHEEDIVKEASQIKKKETSRGRVRDNMLNSVENPNVEVLQYACKLAFIYWIVHELSSTRDITRCSFLPPAQAPIIRSSFPPPFFWCPSQNVKNKTPEKEKKKKHWQPETV